MSQVSVRNITRVFRSASEEQHVNGRSWYLDANSIANALSSAYDVSFEQAAGIIAALSPMQSWGNNVNIATRFIAAGGLQSGGLKANLAKAQAILDGADIVSTLRGNKVVAFFHCIVANGLSDAVCVDRHAYDVATGIRHNDATRPSLSDKRYAECVDAYQRAARILSREWGAPISPAQVQAVTWVAWRARYWSEGAFDVK